MIDGRIRHLGEALAKVRRQRAVTPGERRDRRVVAHRRDRVVAALGERAEHRVELLARVAVQDVTRVERVVPGRRGLPDPDADDALVDPRPVRATACDVTSQLAVDQQAAVGIERQDAARSQPRPAHGDAVRQRHRPCLGGDGEKLVAGDRRREVVEGRCGRAPRRTSVRP